MGLRASSGRIPDDLDPSGSRESPERRPDRVRPDRVGFLNVIGGDGTSLGQEAEDRRHGQGIAVRVPDASTLFSRLSGSIDQGETVGVGSPLGLGPAVDVEGGLAVHADFRLRAFADLNESLVK
jgi:hypothetical protein